MISHTYTWLMTCMYAYIHPFITYSNCVQQGCLNKLSCNGTAG